MMGLTIFLLITLLCVLIARSFALRKQRNAFDWMLTTALFPPVVLILLALPRHEDAVIQSE